MKALAVALGAIMLALAYAAYLPPEMAVMLSTGFCG